jgi:hypothetical protein
MMYLKWLVHGVPGVCFVWDVCSSCLKPGPFQMHPSLIVRRLPKFNAKSIRTCSRVLYSAKYHAQYHGFRANSFRELAENKPQQVLIARLLQFRKRVARVRCSDYFCVRQAWVQALELLPEGTKEYYRG